MAQVGDGGTAAERHGYVQLQYSLRVSLCKRAEDNAYCSAHGGGAAAVYSLHWAGYGLDGLD